MSLAVHPVAPESLKVLVRNPRNATLQWSWRYQGYEAFPLICQVNVASNGISVTVSWQILLFAVFLICHT